MAAEESSASNEPHSAVHLAESAPSQSLQPAQDCSIRDFFGTNMAPEPMHIPQSISSTTPTPAFDTPTPALDTPTPAPTTITTPSTILRTHTSGTNTPTPPVTNVSPITGPTPEPPGPGATRHRLDTAEDNSLNPLSVPATFVEPACAAESDVVAESDIADARHSLHVCTAAQQPLPLSAQQQGTASLAANRMQPANTHSPAEQQSVTGGAEHVQCSTALVPVLASALQLDAPLATDHNAVDSSLSAAFVQHLLSSNRWAFAQQSALANGSQPSTALMVYTDPACLSVSRTSQLVISNRDKMAVPARYLFSTARLPHARNLAFANGPQLTTALAVYADFAGTGWYVATRACGSLGESARSQVPAACCGRGTCQGAGPSAMIQLAKSSCSMSVAQGDIAVLPAVYVGHAFVSGLSEHTLRSCICATAVNSLVA